MKSKNKKLTLKCPIAEDFIRDLEAEEKNIPREELDKNSLLDEARKTLQEARENSPSSPPSENKKKIESN